MTEAAFGIRVPGGDPAALEGAASDLRGASGSFERSAVVLRDSASAPYWTGIASFQFADRCVSQADVIAGGADVLEIAGRIVGELADKLKAAKREAKAALEDAKQADVRRDRAEGEIGDAQRQAGTARFRAFEAGLSAGASGLLGQPNPGADIEREQALREAEAADQRARIAERSRDRALDDLKDAQRLGNKAERAYEDAAEEAAAQLRALVGMTPQAFPISGTPAAATGGPGAPGAVPPIATRSAAPTSDDEEEDDGGFSFGGLVHGALDVGGFVPVLGAFPDGINAGLYAVEGDAKNAAISGGAAIPIVGDIGKGAKMADDALKHGDDVAKSAARQGDEAAVGGTRADPLAPRNSHLAGGLHPKSGIPFRDTGYPDFSVVADKSVEVAGMTGNRRLDARLANEALGVSRTPEGFVWHHVEDGRTMQLVPEGIHRMTGHSGGAELLKRGLVEPMK